MVTHDPALIRILVANLSERLTQWIVDVVDQDPQMQIVGQAQGQVEVLVAASAGVDVVVLGAPKLKPVPGIVSHLLNEYPHTKILVLSTTEEGAMGYWLDVHRCRVEHPTPGTLLSSIQTLFRTTPSL